MTLQPISISELTGRIKSIIETDFQFVYVTGEISNFKHHTSGHFYFALKDESAQVSAVMWSSRNRSLGFALADGLKVNVKGRVTVYEKRGSYQIDVIEITAAGKGDIYVAFEQLKEKLLKEGLFDQRHKKSVRKFPERIIIITSETGAALHDFYKVANRRYPVIRLMLINSKMQGDDAAPEIVAALKRANDRRYAADAVVLARGGGSIEDLWVFNDESVARAIFESAVPVVSAIGHEVDFTISDFVSDMRAPTPSAAAEMILPDISELRRDLDDMHDNIRSTVGLIFGNLNKALSSIESSYHFRKPVDRVKDLNNYLRTIDSDLKRSVKQKLSELKNSLNGIQNSYHFRKPADHIKNASAKLNLVSSNLMKLVTMSLKQARTGIDSAASLLNSFNPENVLKRGFAIIERGEQIIQRNEQLKPGDIVGIRFSDGKSGATINNKTEQI